MTFVVLFFCFPLFRNSKLELDLVGVLVIYIGIREKKFFLSRKVRPTPEKNFYFFLFFPEKNKGGAFSLHHKITGMLRTLGLERRPSTARRAGI